jgi:hypothetical protein
MAFRKLELLLELGADLPIKLDRKEDGATLLVRLKTNTAIRPKYFWKLSVLFHNLILATNIP